MSRKCVASRELRTWPDELKTAEMRSITSTKISFFSPLRSSLRSAIGLWTALDDIVFGAALSEVIIRAVAVAPDSREFTASGQDRIDVDARYNLGTLIVNRVIHGGVGDAAARVAGAKEAAELFCEVLIRHGSTKRAECDRMAALQCSQLHATLDALREQRASDSSVAAAEDSGGSIRARALAGSSHTRLYTLALATALDLATCRG